MARLRLSATGRWEGPPNPKVREWRGDPSREGSPRWIADAMQDYDASTLPRTARGSRPEPQTRPTHVVSRRACRRPRERGCRSRRDLGALRDTRDKRTPARRQRPPPRDDALRNAAAER